MSETANPRIRRRPKRSEFKARLTAQQKYQYVDLITRDSVAGLTVKEIAAKHGISTASIYRWYRQINQIDRSINVEAISEKIDIDGALQLLCDNSKVASPSKREAFFQFIIWIRWPSEPEYYLAAIINCIASYLKQKTGLVHINQLPDQEADVILKYLTLDLAARFSSPYAAFNPDFEIITNGKSRYDDRQFFAEVVNYLLNDKCDSTDNHRPTLERLQSLVEGAAFNPNWSMSPRTFEKHWRARAASLPFLYVEQYHSAFDWSLNPLDSDFAQCVDETVEALDDMRTYLGRVKWVIQKLELVLDPRAMRRINFPKLPDQIEAIPTQNPALSRRLEAKIAELF